MRKKEEKLRCEDLKKEFEAIPPEGDISRLELRSDSNIQEHLKKCRGCQEWLNQHLKDVGEW